MLVSPQPIREISSHEVGEDIRNTAMMKLNCIDCLTESISMCTVMETRLAGWSEIHVFSTTFGWRGATFISVELSFALAKISTIFYI